MSLLLLLMALQQVLPPDSARLWPQVIESLERPGRSVQVVPVTVHRLEPPPLAPSAPPLLSFRYFEGRERHRFGELGLVLDGYATPRRMRSSKRLTAFPTVAIAAYAMLGDREGALSAGFHCYVAKPANVYGSENAGS